MDNYKVALVIPTLNEEKFISACLDSIVFQTFPFAMMDVMVIDGGSNDKTKEIVLRYCEKYSNIRLIHNPKRIQSAAFNIGVASSTAPFVIRLDAHATYCDKYIENCLKKFSAKAEDLGCAPENIGNVGGVWTIRPQHLGLIAESSAILNKSRFGIGGAAFRLGTKAGFVDTVPFGCFPRNVIYKVGGMREDLPRGEDNEYNSRIRKAGYKIYMDPQIVSTYYSRDTFGKNIRQMYSNGKSIGHLIYIDRESVGLRHLIPLLFVAFIICGILLSFVTPIFTYVFFIGIGAYLLADLCASVSAAKKYGIRFLFPLFILFLSVHLSYGIGTIIGLINGEKPRNTKKMI